MHGKSVGACFTSRECSRTLRVWRKGCVRGLLHPRIIFGVVRCPFLSILQVADCIALFSLDQASTIPVDVHVYRYHKYSCTSRKRGRERLNIVWVDELPQTARLWLRLAMLQKRKYCPCDMHGQSVGSCFISRECSWYRVKGFRARFALTRTISSCFSCHIFARHAGSHVETTTRVCWIASETLGRGCVTQLSALPVL